MNKTAIRNFAIWARNKLIADISYKAGLMGITAEGIAEALPQSTSDVEFYNIGTANPYAIQGEEIQQRKSLAQIIKQKQNGSDYKTAYSSVIEEVAYTWFNRLIAVRFMEVNDYLPSHVRVLSSESGKQEPDLVTNPFDADLMLSEKDKEDIIQLKNDNKLDEVFNKLFIKQCNALYRILPRLFENMSDYTELLLNVSFVDHDGVVYHLVHDIDEDDFNVDKGGQVEIIGWLYQYYNAELKDETFALLKNNVKVTKERVPSATQLFTPDWIVRYMVENSLGRLWVEGHPNDVLKSGWKYYLEEAEQEENVKVELDKIRAEYAKLNPEDIKVIDPCMGSGHILVYAFDVLMQIYESAGHTQRDAAKSILEHNLFGLDIDDRAAQLAYFAVMMKARQYNRRILDGETECNVYAIKESNKFDRAALAKLGNELLPVAERLLDAFIDAKEYGSIINVDVTLDELDALDKRLDDVDRMSDYGNLLDLMFASILCNELSVLIKQARVMTQKYDIVVTNPPYMGNGGMDDKLSEFVKKEYPTEKTDLFACFISKGNRMVKENSFNCMVTMQSWMFLSSFEAMRKELLSKCSISCLLHMENMVMGIAFGTAVSVFRNIRIYDYKGKFNYIGLKDIVDAQPKRFPMGNKRDSTTNISKFQMIPGEPVAYWISDKMLEAFSSELTIGNTAPPKQGLATANNDLFLKLWFEIDRNKMGVGLSSTNDAKNSQKKWFPYNKGGAFRRWYGNRDYLVDWENDGFEIRNFKDENGKVRSRPQNVTYYFKEAITWSDITSASFSGRYCEEGFMFDIKGSSGFPDHEMIFYILGLLNSSVSQQCIKILNPTVTTQVGDMARIPVVIDSEQRSHIESTVKSCIEHSKSDWDSIETSWDFKRHPLI